MNPSELKQTVQALFAEKSVSREHALPVLEALLDALEDGVVRAAEPDGERWRVHEWVKQGILLAFRVGQNRSESVGSVFHFRDRDTMHTWDVGRSDRNVRLVPGGTTVRRGAHLGEDVVVMPPAYVNVGAFVGAGTMVDSHALVGSCAQVGSHVHLSAAAQIGGVLEPIGAVPVIVEDHAFVGGGCGVYEGVRVGKRAVLAPGVVLTGAVRLFDLVRETVHEANGMEPLTIPDGAVVVPGSRPARGDYASRMGIQLQAPVIVKYRDEGTDASLILEEALR